MGHAGRLWRARAAACGGLVPRAGQSCGALGLATIPGATIPVGTIPAPLRKSLLGDYLTYGVGRNPEVCVQRKEASGSHDLAEGEP